MRCDIIIPIWNQLEVTRECLEAILKNTGYPYRMILIDNGSDSVTADYLKNAIGQLGADSILVRNNKNLGFVKAVNQGIAASDAAFICIMNNDTIAQDGWLQEMVDVMDAHPEIGLLNPSSNTSGQYPSAGETIEDYALSLKQFKNETQELYTCRGFCMLMRREVVARLGSLDEIYHMGYFDDTDYCKRAQGAGYRTARAKAAYVYHKENTTFKGLKDNEALFKANEKIFFSRWGKPLRVGYFLKCIDSGNRVDRIATDVARSGHQILIFLKKGLNWPVRLDHFDIRHVEVNPYFFSLVSIYKIVRRKRKKKLDILLTDDGILGSFFNAIKFLHGSEVYIDPDKDILLKKLNDMSKVF